MEGSVDHVVHAFSGFTPPNNMTTSVRLGENARHRFIDIIDRVLSAGSENNHGERAGRAVEELRSEHCIRRPETLQVMLYCVQALALELEGQDEDEVWRLYQHLRGVLGFEADPRFAPVRAAEFLWLEPNEDFGTLVGPLTLNASEHRCALASMNAVLNGFWMDRWEIWIRFAITEGAFLDAYEALLVSPRVDNLLYSRALVRALTEVSMCFRILPRTWEKWFPETTRVEVYELERTVSLLLRGADYVDRRALSRARRELEVSELLSAYCEPSRSGRACEERDPIVRAFAQGARCGDGRVECARTMVRSSRHEACGERVPSPDATAPDVLEQLHQHLQVEPRSATWGAGLVALARVARAHSPREYERAWALRSKHEVASWPAPLTHVKSLEALEQLRELLGPDVRVSMDISRQQIDAEDAIELATSPHATMISSLDIRFNWIEDRGLIALAQSPYLRNLSQLMFCGNFLTDHGILALAESSNLANVTHMSFGSRQVTSAGVRALLCSPHLHALDSLKLDGMSLRVCGARAVAESARTGQLTKLSLAGWELGDGGIEELLASPGLVQLRELRLSGNRVGDHGALALAMTPRVKFLTTLDLSYNRIGDDGALALADSMYLRRVTSLDLSSNRLSGGVRRRLAMRFGEGLKV